MKTERELFLRYWTDNNLPYDGDDDDMEVAWTAWHASAQREGYRIVPVEPNEAMLGALQVGFKPDYEGGSYNSYEGYKAMIGAVE